MILNILTSADTQLPRSVLEIHTALNPNEEHLLLDSNIYLDIAVPIVLPVPLFKQPRGSIQAAVKWRKDPESQPRSYKPFFFPRNPNARTESHYAGKTGLYLRIPGIITFGYINTNQISQLQSWYQKIEPILPELLLSSGSLNPALVPQQTVIQSTIQTLDQTLDTGIGLRALDL